MKTPTPESGESDPAPLVSDGIMERAMKPVFLILPLTMSLCACAQQIMTADAGPCKSDASTNNFGGSAAALGSGALSTFMPIAASMPGLGKINVNEAGKINCTRLQNNKSPRIYDLHKIGDGPANPTDLLAQDAKPSCPNMRGEKA
jgi:hypothetical protein